MQVTPVKACSTPANTPGLFPKTTSKIGADTEAVADCAPTFMPDATVKSAYQALWLSPAREEFLPARQKSFSVLPDNRPRRHSGLMVAWLLLWPLGGAKGRVALK